MIEVGIFDGGATDLPFRKTASGQRVVDGTLADLHASHQRVQAAQVRRAVLADSVGFDYYWLTEHHFGVEGAELSTNPLQIGTAIAALTPAHPHRPAGQHRRLPPPCCGSPSRSRSSTTSAAGAPRSGLGRGYQAREAETFGTTYGSGVQDQERNRPTTRRPTRSSSRRGPRSPSRHKGQFFTIPPTYTKWNHAQTIAFFEEGDAGPDVDDVFNIAPRRTSTP